MQFAASYHNLNSDSGSFDYGDEVNLMLTKKFLKHYLVGAKASFYDADRNLENVIGGPSADVSKV